MRRQIFGFEDLPGCQVFDDVPPGTMMIVHSALVRSQRLGCACPACGCEDNLDLQVTLRKRSP